MHSTILAAAIITAFTMAPVSSPGGPSTASAMPCTSVLKQDTRALATAHSVSAPGAPPTFNRGGADAPLPSVTVDVQFAVPTADGTAVAYRTSAPGVTVIAVPVGNGEAAPIASAVTSAMGETVLRLPPGSYWLFVPAFTGDSPPGWERVLEQDMPDGTASLAWREVDIAPDTAARTTATTLTISLAAG